MRSDTETSTCLPSPSIAQRRWQVGDGSSVDKSAPVNVLSFAGGTAVTAGGGHSCAVLNDGTPRCWGENGNGELGNGATSDETSPVLITGLTGAVAIDAGFAHTCAALADGSARCWGANATGQLGNGTTTDALAPVTPVGF